MMTWKMTMNDIRNDNDMKWHDRMTNDNLVYAVLATLAAACWTPPPCTPWVWPRPTTTAFYPQEPILTYLKLYQKPLVLLLPHFTGSELKYLAFKVCIPLFLPSRCILPRGAPYCSLVLTTWGRWAPYYSKSLLLCDTFQLQLITAMRSPGSLWCHRAQPTWTMLVLSELWESIYDLIQNFCAYSWFYPYTIHWRMWNYIENLWKCNSNMRKVWNNRFHILIHVKAGSKTQPQFPHIVAPSVVWPYLKWKLSTPCFTVPCG